MSVNTQLRDFNDDEAVRKFTFENVKNAFEAKKVESRNTVLEFQDVQVDDKKFKLKDQKKAVLNNRDLTLPIKGTVVLKEKDSGKVLDKKTLTLGQLPYYTPRGTYILGGNEYGVFNQFRLKPGVYTRIKTSGESEAQFNLKPGTGRSFRIMLLPETGVFTFVIGQSKDMPVYALLHYAKVPDSVIQNAWGKELFEINREFKQSLIVQKLFQRLFSPKAFNEAKETMNTHDMAKYILGKYSQDSMDARVNKTTVGVPVNGINIALLLAVTKKLIQVSKREVEPDDRDSLEYRKLLGPEDYFTDQIVMDAGGQIRKTAWRADREKNLEKLQPGTFTRLFKDFVTKDSRTATLEQLNPMEIYETKMKTTPLGEGGMSEDAVPDSSRNVHPTHLGFLDSIRTPESGKAGLDLKAVYGTMKGRDGLMYTPVLDKAGKKHYISSQDAVDKVIAFPGQLDKKTGLIKVMKKKEVTQVPYSQVDYFMPDGSNMFTVTTNMTPLLHTAQGNRVLMAAKMIPQALPMKEPEKALIQTMNPKTKESFDKEFGRQIAALESKVAGTVTKVTEDEIWVKDSSGQVHDYDLYNNYPYNRKTGIHQTPLVKVGDKVSKGQLLARSNFTSEDGTFAYGKNLKVGYLAYKGYNFEDGIVISETAADKLTSEHVYSHQVDKEEGVVTGKAAFISLFPTHYSSSDISQIDEDGVVKKGAKVKQGDPLILAAQKRTPSSSDIMLGRLHKSLKNTYRNISEEWEHHGEGEIVDVIKTSRFLKVVVRVYEKMIVGDKLAGRHGNKGVIAKIVPDDKMPKGEDGETLEVLLNPQGIITRINPSQVHETLLAKAAKKLNTELKVPVFGTGNTVDYVQSYLKKAKLPEDGTEKIIDPESGKVLGNVLTGYQYMMKTSSTAEKGISAQGSGHYTSELRPATGKTVGNLTMKGLLAHGARNVIRDVVAHKSEQNNDFWRAIRNNMPTPPPKPTFTNEKFFNSLKAAGINTERKGDHIRIMPLTDKDVEELSVGKLSNAKVVRAQDFRPEKGGLFDESLTGGLEGESWTHYDLPEPMPNPVARENIAVLLNLTVKEFEDILSEEATLPNGKAGGKAIKDELAKINLAEDIKALREDIPRLKGNYRNKAIKKLRILLGAKEHGVHPKDFMVTKVPVLPPKFRPVIPLDSGSTIVADANNLYQDFALANEEYKEAAKVLPKNDPDVIKLKRTLGLAMRKLYGMEDGGSLREEGKPLKGFIRQIVGTSPKFGLFQNKVVDRKQDFSGRAVIIPDPTLGIDEAGIPEEIAWTLYEPHLIRELVRSGLKPDEADKEYQNKTPRAKQALLDVMKKQTVLVNRDPSLHRFNIMALKGRLTNNRTLSLPPLIEKGFNADHDGDAMNIHVLATDEAVEEADQKMLPSKNLFMGRSKQAYWTPSQEAVLGLFRATKKTPGTKPIATFNSARDAIIAYESGKLKLTDPIEIKTTP